MALKSTDQRWGWLTRALHWSIALAVLGMLAAGMYADSPDTSTPAGGKRFDAVIAIHKSFGVVILMLMVFRVLWRFSERTPKLPSMVPLWERSAARICQLVLYVGLFVMPISGYMMASAEGEPVRFFGIRLPQLFDLPGSWVHVAHRTHHTLAYVLPAFIALHIMGALKNHLIDLNDVLRNMAGLPSESRTSPGQVAPVSAQPLAHSIEE